MLDHVGLTVSDLARSKAFYTAALKPLSITLVVEATAEETGTDAWAGFGAPGEPAFAIGDGPCTGGPAHVAFKASSRAVVDAFHRAALAAGGTDNGAPGLRPHYHPTYYAAFILDPDGNNIEAVCHTPD